MQPTLKRSISGLVLSVSVACIGIGLVVFDPELLFLHQEYPAMDTENMVFWLVSFLEYFNKEVELVVNWCKIHLSRKTLPGGVNTWIF